MHTIVAQRPGIDQTVTLTPGAGRGHTLRPSSRQRWNEPRAAAAPSVSFTDLNTFANDEKLLPINENNEEEEEEEDVEYVYEDEPGFDEAFDEDEQPGVGPNYPSGRPGPYDAHRTARTGASAAPFNRGQYGSHSRYGTGAAATTDWGQSFDQYGTQGYNSTSAWGQQQSARLPRAWGEQVAGYDQYDEPRRRLRYQPRLIDREKIRKDLKLKARIIAKLQRRNVKLPEDQKLEFDKDTDLEDLKTLSETSSYSTTAKTAVLFMRRGIVIISRVLEAACEHFPELMQGYSLKGWSNHLFLSLDQFDEMLYDIYDVYLAHLENNPIAQLLFGLATNAVMFVLAKKVVNDPRVESVMQGISSMMKGFASAIPPTVPLTDESKTPMGAAGTRDIFTDGSGAVTQQSDSGGGGGGSKSSPLSGIAAMFDGTGIDVNSVISGISQMFNNVGASSGAPVGDFRGQPIIQEADEADAPVSPVQMTPVSSQDNADLEDLLRRHEDAHFANTASSSSAEVVVADDDPPVTRAATRSTDTKTVLTLD